ncbi:MAG TPA: MnhB domain-containing protein [Paracoccaceae bacterium]|nr:MnhB domain-containing protein [Paracoccaceae bacterium]
MSAFVARGIFPLLLAAALALWARGYAEPGDGFSAGALAGAGAVLLFVACDHDEARRRAGAEAAPVLLAVGLILALATVLAPVAFGLAPVTHFPRPGREVASIGVLELHTATVFDLGVGISVYGAVVSTFDRLFPTLHGEEE